MKERVKRGAAAAALAGALLLQSGCVYAHNYDAQGNPLSREQVNEAMEEIVSDIADQLGAGAESGAGD